jgi:dTDP-4-amino-4,6-dideoxygalactose transaminase
MITTRDPALAARARVMRLHGINRDVFDRYTSSKPSWYYEVVAPGYKYNMTDIAASLGIHQLAKARRFQRRRQAIAARYDAAFAGLPVTLPPKAPAGSEHAWHLYVIRLPAEVDRNDFIQDMARLGIGCSVHFIPLHLQPYWRERYALRPEQFPAATEAYGRLVSLPVYTRMTDADADRVAAAVASLLHP